MASSFAMLFWSRTAGAAALASESSSFDQPQATKAWARTRQSASPRSRAIEALNSTTGSFAFVSSGTATSFTNNGLSTSTLYNYEVRALNGNNISTAFSAVSSTTTYPGQPLNATGFAGTAQDTASILWAWTDRATTLGVPIEWTDAPG